ncbi:hypothetical protein M408DRAFT_23065 [Serendipita vermifera MAFF 305830]|uniref:BRCT domain-containing protein n=1 Tax=Serendipita vermifera MAFF 305830 TaxID=933852 RepID=A0A0C3BCV3_SERVB|nr:hypothetical protein M408DRAFT_23065 [Serendipita vermifera MAFF 305830]
MDNPLKRYGGAVTGIFYAHIYLGTRQQATVLPLDPKIPVVHPNWVEESIAAGRLLHMYDYIEDPTQNMLRPLSPEDRDIAELLKAEVGSPRDNMFELLHRQFPHHHSATWRELYQTSQITIQMAAAQLRPTIQEAINRCIVPLLVPSTAAAAPLRPRAPGTQNEAEHGPANGKQVARPPKENNQAETLPSSGINAGPSVPKGGPDFLHDTLNRPPLQNKQPYLFNNNNPTTRGIEDDEDAYDEGDDDNDRDGDYEDASQMSDTPAPVLLGPRIKTRIGRGVRVTNTDYENMARFVVGLQREPTLADWETFYNLAPENQTRSGKAWNTQFYVKRDKVAGAAVRLGLI